VEVLLINLSYTGACGGERYRFLFPVVSLEFFIDTFRLHYGLEVDPARYRNDYQEYFSAVEDGRCMGLAFMCRLSSNLETLSC
jgi:hypothetical protein